MKKTLTFLVVGLSFLATNAQTNFEALTLSNQFPQDNQTLSFQYNQNLSPLTKEKVVEIVVYELTDKGLIVKEPIVTKKGSVYSATIKIDSNSNWLAFEFSGEKEKDINSNKGYLVPIYTANKVPKENYYRSSGAFHLMYVRQIYGIPSSFQNYLNEMQELIIKYPKVNDDWNYYREYFFALKQSKKSNSKEIIANKILEFENRENLSEGFYTLLSDYYTENKNKSKSDSLIKLKKEKFPNGDWVADEILIKFFAEKGGDKKASLFEEYQSKVSKDKLDESTIKFYKSQIAAAYEKENNAAMAEKFADNSSKQQAAMNKNNKSWAMAEEGKDLQAAKKMSAEATAYTKQQSEKPMDKKPESLSTKQWKEQRDNDYAMCADTYSFILYQLGEYKEGLPYAKVGATFTKFKDAEYNERYAMLLAKAAPAQEAKNIIEGFAKAGKASPKSKEALKEVYTKLNKSDKGFDNYLTTLEASAKIEKADALAKTMINKPSPKFALKDWEGKEVSLESLKGKIVVVDFWATWCGPCIASMPGMKKAQEKLAARDDVKFVFVDTWENVENKLDNSKDFMKKKNFPFYVLMDNDNKMVTDFEVSGIPTKFILDKQGNIRFKSVGFEGNTDALADEVEQMIELAGK